MKLNITFCIRHTILHTGSYKDDIKNILTLYGKCNKCETKFQSKIHKNEQIKDIKWIEKTEKPYLPSQRIKR